MQQPTHPTALRCAPAAAPAVPAGQVFMMDKRFLDPRRPLAAKPTPEQAEEGLMPYSELIIFNPLAFASQDKQVRVRTPACARVCDWIITSTRLARVAHQCDRIQPFRPACPPQRSRLLPHHQRTLLSTPNTH